jgi:hypothetical protein
LKIPTNIGSSLSSLSATQLGGIAIKGLYIRPHFLRVVVLIRQLAALERVPAVKPEQVDELFFGNVLSAK